MAKGVEMILDDEATVGEVKIPIHAEPKTKSKSKVRQMEEPEESINCLSNERVIVKFVPKQTGRIKDPKHVQYGGMSENAVRWFSLPTLDSGMYVNALTDNEKEYLEDIMGLEYNALSIYKKVDNFWDDFQVRLTKQDNFLNLADPNDYIKYKVLLANKNFIAGSLQELQDKPKITYQFVVVKEGEEAGSAKKEMSATMQSYMKFGEIQDNVDMLRVIIETIDGRPLAANTKLIFLQESVNKLIQANPKLFLNVAEDPLLATKTLIKRAIEGGVISNRGGMLFLKSDNSPLCDNGEDPTISMAAKYLASPKRQELKFSIEAKLKV